MMKGDNVRWCNREYKFKEAVTIISCTVVKNIMKNKTEMSQDWFLLLNTSDIARNNENLRRLLKYE